MLISGIVLPQKRTRRRVATIAATMLIATALIASASLINYYAKTGGTVDVSTLLTIDGQPAVELVLSEAGVEVVPGCAVEDGTHTITLNSGYTGDFTIDFVTETTEGGQPCTGDELNVIIKEGVDEITQMVLYPGEPRTFTIWIEADQLIDSSIETYGFTVTIVPYP